MISSVGQVLSFASFKDKTESDLIVFAKCQEREKVAPTKKKKKLVTGS